MYCIFMYGYHCNFIKAVDPSQSCDWYGTYCFASDLYSFSDSAYKSCLFIESGRIGSYRATSYGRLQAGLWNNMNVPDQSQLYFTIFKRYVSYIPCDFLLDVRQELKCIQFQSLRRCSIELLVAATSTFSIARVLLLE